jgi:DedD protein
MAEPPTLSLEDGVRKRAFGRLIIALILIAAAILGLTLIDRFTVPEKPKAPPTPTIAVTPPSQAPATPSPPNDISATPPPPPEVSRVPDTSKLSSALPTPGEKPSSASAPVVPEQIPPQTSAAPPAAASKPAGPSQAPNAATSPVAGEKKSTGPILKLESDSPPKPIPPGKGFTVQMGVFNTYANADALLEKLRERGIPAYSETRVVVGPFRTKQEAKKAAIALKDLGIRGVVTPPKR